MFLAKTCFFVEFLQKIKDFVADLIKGIFIVFNNWFDTCDSLKNIRTRHVVAIFFELFLGQKIHSFLELKLRTCRRI